MNNPTPYTDAALVAAIAAEAQAWARFFNVADVAELEGRRAVMRANVACGFVEPLREYLLGDRFAELMAEDISPTALHTIRLRNASPEYAGDICATHDFCDANMVMLEAFEQVIGREPAFLEGTDEAGNHSPEGDADMRLWGAAWNHAKAAHLTATPAEVEATT